ncbi:hypothetical protein K9M79_05350 [Candidatus Woesearchaeota archaeon]|nr:hypothetical protein [Candidatus Woesearchaeota archaeon]
MLKTQEMSKVFMVIPKDRFEKTVDTLYKLKVFHIIEHTKTDEYDIGSPILGTDILSDIQVRIRSIASQLKINLQEDIQDPLYSGFVNEIPTQIIKLHNEVSDIIKDIKKCEDKKRSLNQELKVLETLDLFTDSAEIFKKSSHIVYRFGMIHDLDEDALILENEHELKTIEGQPHILIFAKKKDEKHLDEILGSYKFKSFEIEKYASDKRKLIRKELEQNLSQTNEDILQCKNQLVLLSKMWKRKLQTFNTIVSEKLEKYNLPLSMGITKHSYFIKAYVPTDILYKVKHQLFIATDRKIIFKIENLHHSDNVPVKLKNPAVVNSFEFFLKLFALPKYGEIDPTMFIFLSFPFFFGFILGDAGYGIISFLIFWFLKKKMPQYAKFFNILLLSSISSIIFGYIFGEFFGGADVFGLFTLTVYFNRELQMIALLVIAIAMGFIHVNWGLIVGFTNELRSHGLKKAIYTKGSWWLLQISVTLIALSYLGMIKAPVTIGYALMAISAVMLFLGEGIIGIIEIPGIFTNFLSYGRLMAVGASSVGLAVVINQLTSQVMTGSISGYIIGTLIFILGHTINLLLGCMGSFLHSLRLHYIEFFTKFYHGGGTEYKPFGTKLEG